MLQLRPAFLISLATLLPVCHGFMLATSSQKGTRAYQVLQKNSQSDDEEPDLFEYFDPLLSPHEYPNGIGPDASPKDQGKDSQANSKPKKPFGLDLLSSQFPSEFASSPEELAEQTKQSKFKKPEDEEETKEKEELDLFDVFDPTLSPHAYPNGIPSTKKSTMTVGILLMDHGSRNEASNQRLHDMAKLYQNTLGDPERVIVKGAHMEIASPTIPETLQAFAEMGVDEIVCHPYFLSPGRHVKDDIPRIIQDAIESLGLDIPVKTTSPVGSHTELMINAIHSLVEESSPVLSQYTTKGKLGGGSN